MARPSKLVTSDLVHAAQEALPTLPQGKLAIQLRAIISCGEYPQQMVADILGISRQTLWRWIRLFQAGGMTALQDQPKGHRPAKLSATQLETIGTWLERSQLPDATPTHWTLERLQAIIAEEFQIHITVMPLWRHLQNLGFRLKQPRPRHRQADPDQQEQLNKNSTT